MKNQQEFDNFGCLLGMIIGLTPIIIIILTLKGY